MLTMGEAQGVAADDSRSRTAIAKAGEDGIDLRFGSRIQEFLADGLPLEEATSAQSVVSSFALGVPGFTTR